MKLTMRQFTIFLLEIGKIMNMESGGSVTQPHVYSGQAAVRAAKKMFGNKEK